MKLYSRLKSFPPAHRDCYREKYEMLTQIRQTRKPNESLLWAPFWTSDTLLTIRFSRSRCVWVNLYGRAVNADNFSSDINYVFVLKFFKNTVNCPVFRPTIKSDIYRMPIAELLWQRPPLAAVFNYVQHCTHEIVIWNRWFFALLRHQMLYFRKLFSCQSHTFIIQHFGRFVNILMWTGSNFACFFWYESFIMPPSSRIHKVTILLTLEFETAMSVLLSKSKIAFMMAFFMLRNSLLSSSGISGSGLSW